MYQVCNAILWFCKKNVVFKKCEGLWLLLGCLFCGRSAHYINTHQISKTHRVASGKDFVSHQIHYAHKVTDKPLLPSLLQIVFAFAYSMQFLIFLNGNLLIPTMYVLVNGILFNVKYSVNIYVVLITFLCYIWCFMCKIRRRNYVKSYISTGMCVFCGSMAWKQYGPGKTRVDAGRIDFVSYDELLSTLRWRITRRSLDQLHESRQ